jgi:hypothetical protein
MTILIMMEPLAAAHIILSSLIGAPLLYAGVSKVMEGSRFRAALAQYRLPVPASTGVVAAIAGVELTLGAVGLLAPVAATAIVTALGYLLLASALERARRLGAIGECGCFGALAASIDRAGVLRNLAFAVLAMAVAVARGTGLLPAYDVLLGVWSVIAIALAAAACDTALAVRASMQR